MKAGTKRTYGMISFAESSRADKTKSTLLEDKMVVYLGVVILKDIRRPSGNVFFLDG